MGTYERKTRDIQKSLHRRARMRRAYFKMLGEDPKKRKTGVEMKKLESGQEIDISDVSDSDSETSKKEVPESPKKLTGRQLARKKRAEKFHLEKQKEEDLLKAKARREQHKKTMTKRTSKGQPRLGSQMGVLLDKIKKTEHS